MSIKSKMVYALPFMFILFTFCTKVARADDDDDDDILGELAIGTNYGVQRFTKNMLFDEKMGGTIHLALGAGYPESGSKNVSPIHWDILKDMKSKDSIIYLDGKEIYKAGKWLIGK